MTYNVHGEYWKADSSEKLAEVIKERNVDVVCLQEVVRKWEPRVLGRKKDGEREAKIAPGAVPHQNIPVEVVKLLGKRYKNLEYLCLQTHEKDSGNAIIYNQDRLLPVGSMYCRKLEYVSRRSPFEEFSGKMVVPMRRILVSQKFLLDDKPVIVYNVHLDFWGRDAKRISQLKELFAFWDTDREKLKPIEVLAGDFNNWTLVFPKLMQPLQALSEFLKKNEFLDVSCDIPWTFSFVPDEVFDIWVKRGKISPRAYEGFVKKFEGSLHNKMDHVWIKGCFKVLSCSRLDIRESDHYPILAEIEIPEVNETFSQ